MCLGLQNQSTMTSHCHQSGGCVTLPTLAVASQHGQQYGALSSRCVSLPCLQTVVRHETPHWLRRRGWLPRSRHNVRTSGESTREASQRSFSGPASRRSLGPGSRHSMASAASAAGSHGNTPDAAPGPGEIRSSGTYRRAMPPQSTQSAPQPPLPEHAASADVGAPPGPGGSSDSGDADSSGTHHGSDAGQLHHRANSLPEGLLPGGADIERGITYEGGLRHHTGTVAAAAL